MNKKYMKLALEEAKKALLEDEVPVGAVIVKDDKVIAKAHNIRENSQIAIDHAEVIAIKEACEKIGYWRLDDCDIYVTMEPCLMCAGAIINARINNVYFGAYDKRVGVISKDLKVFDYCSFNHNPNYIGGVMEDECSTILTSYFQKKRKKSKGV